MARQMEVHIRRNQLLTVHQSCFRRHHSTTVAVLKITEDIRSNMEDEQVMVWYFWISLRHLMWLYMGCCCVS
jgi:hypothetical protein